jgi:hypothetical protein
MNWDTAPQELESLRAQVEALTKERDELQVSFDAQCVSADKLFGLLADANTAREFLIANATRSVSWIDGVIELLELYRPETPGQREWQKRMIGEGYAIIQAHVEVRMLEDEK